MSFDIAALNIVDFATIIVLVISGVLATLRGMTREIMGLAGWPISIVAARLTAPYLEPLLTDTIRVEGISSALAWGIPFIVVVVLWFAFASVVSPGLSKAGLGGLDRWLGFLFGLIRGFVIVLVIYVGAVIAAEGEDRLPGLVTDAQIIPALRESAHLMSGVLPPDMGDRIVDNLPDAAPATEELQEAGEAVGEAVEDSEVKGLDLLDDESGS
ncbi:MAG TPA: colicin V production protein [Alphaproteobacteria bacterium]|jgi:membrane protein required for colicin V production|nr:colicin V production protein [Alphaproteobacteria bacterium]|tara:strand:- start:2508 stop:3146 length:639 start_codon:yes stop_codon:yes gene_type:complete